MNGFSAKKGFQALEGRTRSLTVRDLATVQMEQIFHQIPRILIQFSTREFKIQSLDNSNYNRKYNTINFEIFVVSTKTNVFLSKSKLVKTH